MDVYAIQLINRSTTVDLPLFGAQPTDRFVIKAADGLGPGAINLIAPDGVYQGTTVSDRELVIRIGLNADYRETSIKTVGQLRSELYRLLNPQSGGIQVNLKDKTGSIFAKTYGYARNFEINPFSADPEVLVTINCLKKPYWEAPALVHVGAPFYGGHNIDIPNLGDVDTGFLLHFQSTATMNGLILRSVDSPDDQRLFIDYHFYPTTLIFIDTREGQRSVYVIRGTGIPLNIPLSLLANVDSSSVWPKVPSGGGTFSITDGNSDDMVTTTAPTIGIDYTPLYWGV